MAKHKALGRGLAALIPPVPVPAEPEPDSLRLPPPSAVEDADTGGPLYISLARIAPNPNQPRKRFSEEELSGLAASIREQGILQPLVVRRRKDGDGYELVIGERRWRAAQLAGLDEAPAVIVDVTDRAALEMALVENVQRADLNPMELARAYDELIRTEGMKQDEVGKRVGIDRSSVSNHLRLFELATEIQQDLIDARLTMGHAKAILQAPAERRMMVRDQVLRGGLTVRATEELSRRIASSETDASKKVRPGPTRDVDIVGLEDRLRRELQTKVRIIGRRSRGRIELSYFGEVELERLAARLFGGE